MKIQVNTDAHIAGHEALVEGVNRTVSHVLHRFQDHVTRVEVHLSDQNGHKSGPPDKRCVMEARLEGRQPVAATEIAGSQDQAVREFILAGRSVAEIEREMGVAFASVGIELQFTRRGRAVFKP